jgi:uncharacterized protein (TIGR02453 family)
MAEPFKGFPPETLSFLRELKENNDRQWFAARKEDYERCVKAPMVDLVSSLGQAVQSFAPELVVDPKRAIYRFYRDTRFSEDKSPYKTQLAAIFAPRNLPKHHGAALYFHISPEDIVMAGGVYMPDGPELLLIRRHIAENWPQLSKILNERGFKKLFGAMEGDQLKRPPRGFSEDHPAGDLLRYKQYYVSISDPPELAESPKLIPRFLTAFTASMPLIRFLNKALI